LTIDAPPPTALPVARASGTGGGSSPPETIRVLFG
jgi:hypothetical protein